MFDLSLVCSQGAVAFTECAELDLRSRLAIFAITDVLVVTSLRDGLNLLPLEYMLAREADPGALVVSEFSYADSPWNPNLPTHGTSPSHPMGPHPHTPLPP